MSSVVALEPIGRQEARQQRSPGSERVARFTPESVLPASFPGAPGKTVYTRSPYLAWPGSTWVMNSDGSAQALLAAGGAGMGDNSPSWSPGGTLIAFSRDMTASTTDAANDIFVMRSDGANVHRLTATPADDVAPSFSPDGARIVFSSNRSGDYEIYSMNIDGSDVTRLTHSAGDDWTPSWSPDRTRIAFASNRTGNWEIYTIKADGTELTQLTHTAGNEYAPVWSPDGSRIAFESTQTGDFDVFVMNANGSGVINLSSDPSSTDGRPSWSPDGSIVVYEGDPFGDLDVIVISSTGGTPFLLTDSLADEWNPDWQPIPEFPLVDSAFSSFHLDIVWLVERSITAGCSSERYCPDDPVTRAQMASFLVRALDLTDGGGIDYFTDDNTSVHEIDINRLRYANITTGCGGANFCPELGVTRGQMAAFLHRAFGR